MTCGMPTEHASWACSWNARAQRVPPLAAPCTPLAQSRDPRRSGGEARPHEHPENNTKKTGETGINRAAYERGAAPHSGHLTPTPSPRRSYPQDEQRERRQRCRCRLQRSPARTLGAPTAIRTGHNGST